MNDLFPDDGNMHLYRQEAHEHFAVFFRESVKHTSSDLNHKAAGFFIWGIEGYYVFYFSIWFGVFFGMMSKRFGNETNAMK